MKSFRFLFLALGLVLFGLVLAQSDLTAVASHVGGLGWGVLVGIPAVSLLPFIADTLSWQSVTPNRKEPPIWSREWCQSLGTCSRP